MKIGLINFKDYNGLQFAYIQEDRAGVLLVYQTKAHPEQAIRRTCKDKAKAAFDEMFRSFRDANGKLSEAHWQDEVEHVYFEEDNQLTGIEAMAKERGDQIRKGLTPKHDAQVNSAGQLEFAAISLLSEQECPEGWNKGWWSRLCKKPYKERLAMAGAMLAAEYDRLNFNK